MSVLLCGSIEDWSSKFFNAKNDTEQLDALKFLHCQPVVDSFDGDDDQLALLDSTIYNALMTSELIEAPDKYVANLCFKNYVRFELNKYSGLKTTEVFATGLSVTQREFRTMVGDIPSDADIRMDKNLGEPHDTYAAQIAQEINAVVQ